MKRIYIIHKQKVKTLDQFNDNVDVKTFLATQI